MQPILNLQSIYLTDATVTWALIIATLLGALLGIERSLAGKHAGMRTYALVSLGSCLFTVIGVLASMELSFIGSGVNPLGIAASVVIGIGFIGSGLAVFKGEHPVELTTATGIWVAASIGMACGFGFYSLATTATILGLIIFSLFFKIENAISGRFGYSKEKE